MVLAIKQLEQTIWDDPGLSYELLAVRGLGKETLWNCIRQFRKYGRRLTWRSINFCDVASAAILLER